MRHPLVAGVANFFLPGTGYLLAGTKRALGVLWLIGAVGLTWVEFGIRESEPTLWAIMFVAVFIMNTAFAIDAYRFVQDRNRSTAADGPAVAVA